MTKTTHTDTDAGDPAAAPAMPAKPGTITLETPLTRGERTITSIALRKPAAGELRGVSLADLLRLDVAALITLLPRITTPTLTAQDVGQLDLADLAAIGGEVVSFFMTKADRAAISPFPTA